MVWVRSLVHEVGGIAWSNRFWMTWNTLLAVVPVALGAFVFRLRSGWGAMRWLGLVAFVLFLPNAPYVVTDLVQLREDAELAGHDTTVLIGLLPVYAVFIAVGFAAYAVSLDQVGAWLRHTGRARLVPRVEAALHGLCAVGVLLGRVARLNSWDTLTQPARTITRAVDTFSWQGSPGRAVALFVVIWLGHAATSAVLASGAAQLRRLGARGAAPAASAAPARS